MRSTCLLKLRWFLFPQNRFNCIVKFVFITVYLSSKSCWGWILWGFEQCYYLTEEKWTDEKVIKLPRSVTQAKVLFAFYFNATRDSLSFYTNQLKALTEILLNTKLSNYFRKHFFPKRQCLTFVLSSLCYSAQ